MTLVEIFIDQVVNRKSLKDYVEIWKGLNERGKFNDKSLIQAENNLQRLKQGDKVIYEKMYTILAEVMKRDAGHSMEYAIDFVREILKIYQGGISAKQVCEEYERVLEHHFRDA